MKLLRWGVWKADEAANEVTAISRPSLNVGDDMAVVLLKAYLGYDDNAVVGRAHLMVKSAKWMWTSMSMERAKNIAMWQCDLMVWHKSSTDSLFII